MTNQEVARSYANGSREYAKNPSGSLFYHGNSIYSYGQHHVIALINRVTNTAYVNMCKYSVTTSKQTTLVKRELLKAGFHVECVPVIAPAFHGMGHPYTPTPKY